MKGLILVAMVLISGGVMAQARLEVVVTNVQEAKGTVRVGIFSDSKSFLKEATFGKVVKATKGEVRVVFENIPPGTYGVSVIHDENENGELDSGLFGIPKEGFGFANDAMGTFGPPGFEKASINIGMDPKIISIGMKYL
jgi:uncharacterized protein (DUF2141 family)